MPPSNSQVDQLGSRLRAAGAPNRVSDADQEMYGAFREAFHPALEEVHDVIAAHLPQGGRLKTLESTVAKLVRQPTVRLSQIQDIAGTRLIVDVLSAQDAAVAELLRDFPGASLDDRRSRPSHGYRAVHVIARATHAGRLVEIQVRTEIQDLWAQISEKLADRYGLDVKYGGGPNDVQDILNELSAYGEEVDDGRDGVRRLGQHLDNLERRHTDMPRAAEARAGIVELRETLQGLESEYARRMVTFRNLVRRDSRTGTGHSD